MGFDFGMGDSCENAFWNGESEGWHNGCEATENDYVFKIAKYLNQKQGLKSEEEIAKTMEDDFEINQNLAKKGANAYMTWLKAYHPAKHGKNHKKA